ncbi:MAG: pitrilysin family protein [Chitinophagaceae bacterium]|nr:pitrilysin family protein [Chitinophagaceae bacterium]
MINRTIAPPIVDATDFKLTLKPYEKYTLDNGIEVYSINAGTQEVMMVEWVFYAGNSYEERNLIASATNNLLKNGTSTKTAFQINEHFEYYGSHFSRACYNETSTLTLHCLDKHIGELLPVVKELVTDATFPQEELDIFKTNMKQRLTVNLKKSEFVANRLIDAYIYGEDHPYGSYSRHEDLDALQREELLAFYKKYYTQGRCIIFTAGKLPADLPRLLNEQFGHLPITRPEPRQVPFHDMEPSPEFGKPLRIINDAEGVQGAIRMGRLFPNRHHPDFMKMQVLNNLFGGFFGSRLMSNIREDKGYTYGIYSYLQNHIQSCALIVSTEAGKDVCEAAVKEIYYEMKTLREEPVEDDELSLVRNYMIGTILSDLDGPFHILARWKNIILNGLDESYFYESIKTIKTVGATELMELANKYYSEKDWYELIVY